VAREYFHELMCMRCCEWSLKAQEPVWPGDRLWLAASSRRKRRASRCRSTSAKSTPTRWSTRQPPALSTCTRRWPRVNDRNAAVALGAVEALATTAGERSFDVHAWAGQPLLQALAFPDRAVRYSAAIAIANAGPRQPFRRAALSCRIWRTRCGAGRGGGSCDCGEVGRRSWRTAMRCGPLNHAETGRGAQSGDRSVAGPAGA